MVIVTTSEFTDNAFRAATELGIEMVPGDKLASIVREVGAEDLVDHVAAGNDLDEVSPVESENESESAADTDRTPFKSVTWALGGQILTFWDMLDPELLPILSPDTSAILLALLWFS